MFVGSVPPEQSDAGGDAERRYPSQIGETYPYGNAGYLAIAKEFHESKPRTWAQATPAGRRAFAEYLSNLRMVLGL